MELVEVYQQFPDKTEGNIQRKILQELDTLFSSQQLKEGSEIAITAGSRGIHQIDQILKYTVNVVKQFGHIPYIVPAMGSHGGATAEGQLKILEHLGITEESVGAEIRSSMDVVLMGYTEKGVPAYLDKHASQADGIVVVNRVKVHTAFNGEIESGLSKMVTIGLGKIKGASFLHGDGAQNMEKNIVEGCKTTLTHAPPIMGLGIVENAYDHTAIIQGVDRKNWFEEEASLLKQSKDLMPQLPCDDIDLLIVEEMGKNYSGTGMDPNIIGRWRIEELPEPSLPQIKRIITLNLSKESYGNAQGVGLGDFITEQLADQIDRHATYTNALTSTYLQRAMLPLIYETEKQAFVNAKKSLGQDVRQEEIKLVQVPNTLHLHRLFVTPAVLKEMEKHHKDFELGMRTELSFDHNENLKKRLLH